MRRSREVLVMVWLDSSMTSSRIPLDASFQCRLSPSLISSHNGCAFRCSVVSSVHLAQSEKNAWRDFLLQKLVVFLSENKDEILSDFLKSHSGTLTIEDIKHHDLMDFDVSITLHCDQRSSFGLGFGFFKANLIR